MKKLTSKCGYPVLVNFAHVADVSICDLSDLCDFESNARGEFQGLGLKIKYVNEDIRIVRECLFDLEALGVFEDNLLPEPSKAMISADGEILRVGDLAWVRNSCQGREPIKIEIGQILDRKVVYSEPVEGTTGAKKDTVFKFEPHAYWT